MGVNYTLYANRTLIAQRHDKWISLSFPTFDGMDGLTQTFTKNSMAFRAHLSKAGIIDCDLAFVLAHSGFKFFLNGTQNIQRTMTIQVASSHTLKKRLDRVYVGNDNILCFDFSDVRKSGLSFNYANGKLNITGGTAFFFDPYIFSDGFESGSYSAWTGTNGDPAVVDTYKREGTYSSQCDSGEFSYKDFTAQTTLYVRFYIMFTAVPTTTSDYDRFLRICSGSGAWGTLIGRVKIRRTGGGTCLTIESVNPSATYDYFEWLPNTYSWQCVEIKHVKSATVGEWRAWINGTEVITQTGLNTNADADMTKIGVGSDGTGGYTVVTYIDSVIVDTSYIGPISAGENLVREVSVSFTSSLTDYRVVQYKRANAMSLTSSFADYRKAQILRSLSMPLSSTFQTYRLEQLKRAISYALTSSWASEGIRLIIKEVSMSLATAWANARQVNYKAVIVNPFIFAFAVWEAAPVVVSVPYDFWLVALFLVVPIGLGLISIKWMPIIAFICGAILILVASYLVLNPYVTTGYYYIEGAWHTNTVAIPLHPYFEMMLILLGALIIMATAVDMRG